MSSEKNQPSPKPKPKPPSLPPEDPNLMLKTSSHQPMQKPKIEMQPTYPNAPAAKLSLFPCLILIIGSIIVAIYFLIQYLLN
jgi:hypothetical protein